MAATARVTATAPWTGTHFIASYQVTGDHRWASPGHSYSTASVRQMPGLNLYVRQTIPGSGHAALAHGSHRRSAQSAGSRLSFARHRGRTATDAGGESTQRSRRIELHFLSERFPAHRFPPALHSRIPSVPAASHPQTQSLRWLGRGREPPQRRRDALAARTSRAARFHPRRGRLGRSRRSARRRRPWTNISAIPNSAASAIGSPASCRQGSAN